jgi:hypothetical protein
LKEVFRGYKGDKKAPQLIADEEVVKDTPLPPIKGSFFKAAGGKGFQRPFELATQLTKVRGNSSETPSSDQNQVCVLIDHQLVHSLVLLFLIQPQYLVR